jgi:hypothetical protein
MVERFRALADLSLSRLREQVRTCLMGTDSILLSQLLRRFPPREGILEVIGYLVVAIEDPQSYVADDQFTQIEIATETSSTESWRVPEVLFMRA